jgi:hypothetical protein
MKHSFKLLFVICAGLLAGLLAACGGGGTATSPEPAIFNCQGSYTGPIVPPPQAVRIANRDRQIAEGGPLGGGVDGGIYLEGGFGFETDAACNIVKGEFILHGGQATITGGHVNADGSFAGTHVGGPFEGQVTGTSITCKVHEGGGREWVYGECGPSAFAVGGHI